MSKPGNSGQKVYVGMSGGVDSSVTAALLKQQGYDVTGVYMKNWSEDLPGMVCPWKEDYQDAKRVAVQLDIPFKLYDFQVEYRQKVVDYMVAEYQAGRTPNPDVMCNQEVKFKLFLQAALADGADCIATGHYAKAVHSTRRPEFSSGPPTKSTPDAQEQGILKPVQDDEREDAMLQVAANADKDQTYFLYRVTEDALSKTLMPIGDIATKTEVRQLAHDFGLVTADKKDSQGICFVGKIGIKDFLLHELGPQPAGPIIDQDGAIIGQHDGAIFYTIGQRHGLDVGGGLPYYVVGKDMTKNEVYVTTMLDDQRLWHDKLHLTDVHWINDAPPEAGKTYQIRTRYRAPLVNCELSWEVQPLDVSVSEAGLTKLTVSLAEEIRAITPGQSAVIYDGVRVLGGGIVT